MMNAVLTSATAARPLIRVAMLLNSKAVSNFAVRNTKPISSEDFFLVQSVETNLSA